jgi:FixJ family two-component response regulator
MSQRSADMLTLLDRVEDRDRAILAMLLEQIHPDDIAATVGISAAALRRRRTHIIARLAVSAEAASHTDTTADSRVNRSVAAAVPVISMS